MYLARMKLHDSLAFQQPQHPPISLLTVQWAQVLLSRMIREKVATVDAGNLYQASSAKYCNPEGDSLHSVAYGFMTNMILLRSKFKVLGLRDVLCWDLDLGASGWDFGCFCSACIGCFVGNDGGLGFG